MNKIKFCLFVHFIARFQILFKKNRLLKIDVNRILETIEDEVDSEEGERRW